MSVDLIVYLRRASMPTPVRWQQAIAEAGFPVELDTDFDVDTSRGFRPCKLRGAVSGFEYFSAWMTNTEAAEVGAPLGTDFSVTLVTHSDLREFACSIASAAALAKTSGGLLVDPQSGESFGAAEAIGWATEQFAEAERA